MDDEFLLISTAFCLYMKTQEPRKKTRKWVKQSLLDRQSHTHINLMEDLRLEPPDWRNYLRMDQEAYLHLLQLVTPLIKKKDTNMRQCITPHERLAATLRFLSTGMSYEELKLVTAISSQSLGKIIPETCIAILRCLKGYFKMPQNQDEWKEIARDFEKKCDFPNCLGAIDGKHIRISPPRGSGSFFWNYKHFHSVVLMACANSNYEFIWCEAGTNGRISDGEAIKNTQFYENLSSRSLGIPPADSVNGSQSDLPYVFVGDEAFSLRADFMKPFDQKTVNDERRVYNYRLSQARLAVENAFGILANRFCILHTSINLDLNKIDIVILTCCALHNFLCKNSASYLQEEAAEEITFEKTLAPLEVSVTDTTDQAKLVRDAFVEYFNGEGAVEFKDERADI